MEPCHFDTAHVYTYCHHYKNFVKFQLVVFGQDKNCHLIRQLQLCRGVRPTPNECPDMILNSFGCLAKIRIHQLFVDTGCRLDDFPRVLADRDDCKGGSSESVLSAHHDDDDRLLCNHSVWISKILTNFFFFFLVMFLFDWAKPFVWSGLLI